MYASDILEGVNLALSAEAAPLRAQGPRFVLGNKQNLLHVWMVMCICVFIQSRADISIELLKPHLVPTVKLKAEQLVIPRKWSFMGTL